MSTMDGYFDVTDYTSVQAAQTACENAGGGIVYFPPGSYRLLTTVQIGATRAVPVQWRGAGAGVSLIVGAVSGAVQPIMVHVLSQMSLVTVEDIGFIGNGYAVGGASPAFASPMIQFETGTHHKVLNCYFTSPSGHPSTTGPCVTMFGVTDGEVAGCRFFNFGFVDGSIGSTDHTDAVFIDPISVGVRVHDNHLENGGLGGIRNEQSTGGPGPGGWCDLSHNFVTNVWGGAVILHNYDTRAGLNDTSYTHTVPLGQHAGSQDIDVGKPKIFALVGNLASYCDGDGIATNGCSSGTLIGNVCWDNVIIGGDCGLQFIGQAGGLNFGMAMVGNMCFDDGPGKQLVGIHLFTNDKSFSTYSSVLGCVTYFDATTSGTPQGIAESIYGDDKVLTQDDSNAILANIDWPERLHEVMKQPVSPTSPFLLRDVPIPSRFMLTRCGIRITGGGVISGHAGIKTFELGFAGSRSNIFSITVPSNVATWSFAAILTNDMDSTMVQAASACFCGGSAVLGVFETTLNINTAPADLKDLDVQLWVTVANSNDSIQSDYFNIERC